MMILSSTFVISTVFSSETTAVIDEPDGTKSDSKEEEKREESVEKMGIEEAFF